MRVGGPVVLGKGTVREVSMICESQTRTDATAAFRRDPPPPDVAARRQAGRGGIPLRGLARGGRSIVVAGAAARTPGRPRIALPHDLGVRGLAGPARGAACARLDRGARGL